MRKVTTLILDMDGVLIHSHAAHEKAFREVLSRFGSVDFDYSEIVGMRTDEAFETVFHRRGISVSREQLLNLVDQKRYLARQEIERTRPLAPDCRKVLVQLKSRVRLGLATSSSAGQMELFLQISQTRELFDAVVCGEQVRSAKPNSEIFLLCSQRLRTSPRNCLVVEDSANGVRAAVAGGFSVLVLGNTMAMPNHPQIWGQCNDLSQIEGYLERSTS